jgi:hypothetical protein
MQTGAFPHFEKLDELAASYAASLRKLLATIGPPTDRDFQSKEMPDDDLDAGERDR